MLDKLLAQQTLAQHDFIFEPGVLAFAYKKLSQMKFDKNDLRTKLLSSAIVERIEAMDAESLSIVWSGCRKMPAVSDQLLRALAAETVVKGYMLSSSGLCETLQSVAEFGLRDRQLLPVLVRGCIDTACDFTLVTCLFLLLTSVFRQKHVLYLLPSLSCNTNLPRCNFF